MRILSLKPFTIAALLFISTSGLGNEEKSKISRRGFLGSLVATTATAVVAPSVLSAGANTTAASSAVIPQALLKKLAALRIASLDTIDSGLGVYVKQLKKILSATKSDKVASLLNARILKAEESLAVYDQVRAAAQGEMRTSFNKGSNAGGDSLTQTDHQSTLKLNQKKARALRDLSSLPPDSRFLIIRSLLDVRLLNRMAWQAHYGSASLVLTSSDVSLLEEYRHALELTLSDSAKGSLSKSIIPSLLREADFVLENTSLSLRAKKARSFSCKKIL